MEFRFHGFIRLSSGSRFGRVSAGHGWEQVTDESGMNLTVPFLNFLYPILIRIGLLTDSNLPTYLSQNDSKWVRSAALHTVYPYRFFQTSNSNIIFISSHKRRLRRKRKTINTRFLVCQPNIETCENWYHPIYCFFCTSLLRD
jgi:hypothetical protein